VEYSVRIEPSAEADLETVYDYLENNFGEKVADHRYEELHRFCRNLGLFPWRGAPRPGFSSDFRLGFFKRRAIVAYAIDEGNKAVSLLRVFMAGANFDASLKHDSTLHPYQE
jgi:plasmid stabilization system protein ParE